MPSQLTPAGRATTFNAPIALASDGSHVWVANFGNKSVTEVNASDGSFVRNLSGGSYNFGFPAGAGVWRQHVFTPCQVPGQQHGRAASSAQLVTTAPETAHKRRYQTMWRCDRAAVSSSSGFQRA